MSLFWTIIPMMVGTMIISGRNQVLLNIRKNSRYQVQFLGSGGWIQNYFESIGYRSGIFCTLPVQERPAQEVFPLDVIAIKNF